MLTRLLLFAPYIPHFTMQVRRLSAAQYGLLQAIYYFVVFAAEVPTGVLADRFGRKATLALGAGINGIGCWVFAMSHDFATFALGEVLFGLGTALVSGADTALLYDSLAAERREAQFPRAMGAAEAAWLLATVGGYLASDRYLVVGGDPVLAYWISGAGSLVAVGVACLFTEPPKGDRQSAREITVGALRDVVTVPGALRVIAFSVGVFALLRAAVVYFYNPVLEAQGVPPNLYGTILAGLNLAGAVAALSAHRWLDRGERTALVLVPGALLLMFLLLAAGGPWPLFLIQGAAFGLYPVLTRHLLNRLVPAARRRATILSLDSLACRVVFSPMSIFAGWALGHMGLKGAMAATAALACVPFLVIPLLKKP